MKKLVVLLMSVALVNTGINAQAPVSPLAEGVKLLNYEKNKSALTFFKEALDKTPGDPETTFWYGQALLSQNYNGVPTPDYIQKAKELYQTALQSKGNDPWLLIGMAHIQYLEGADNNVVKQNLEVAITTSLQTKGKNKGKPNPEIVNAIGRVFAELPSNIGDHQYAIDKLREAITASETVNANLFLNLGINYLKLGGEHGGEAVSAFQEAINKDPKNAYAYYRIGKVYQTQSNKESLEENFRKATDLDLAIAPVYMSKYTYYSDKNTDSAKSNLDTYLKYADKDPVLDFLNADYLFQAGQYDASLEKAKILESTVGATALPRLSILLAYIYDRKSDSATAKTYIDQFLANKAVDKVESSDYELSVKILSKFPGNQAVLADLLTKAIAAETQKNTKLKYYKLGGEMYEKANMYVEALKWYGDYFNLRGLKDEVYYFKVASLSVSAKDGVNATAVAKEYIAAFPDKPQGYTFNNKAAKLLDTNFALGLQFEAAKLQNEFFAKDPSKYKQGFVQNYYTMMSYYNEVKDLENAIAMCDKVLEIIPDEPQTVKIKEGLVKNWEIIKKMKNNPKGAPTDPPAKKN
jgi:tetratricopeptide (TPR) repeat protein